MARKKNTAAVKAAKALILSGCSRSLAAGVLQRDHQLSRASAYRYLTEAEASLPAEHHHPSADPYLIDTIQEAQRLYERALADEEPLPVLRSLLAMVHRHQLDSGRINPLDNWTASQAEQQLPF